LGLFSFSHLKNSTQNPSTIRFSYFNTYRAPKSIFVLIRTQHLHSLIHFNFLIYARFSFFVERLSIWKSYRFVPTIFFMLGDSVEKIYQTGFPYQVFARFSFLENQLYRFGNLLIYVPTICAVWDHLIKSFLIKKPC
jgi:hypothetical protein